MPYRRTRALFRVVFLHAVRTFNLYRACPTTGRRPNSALHQSGAAGRPAREGPDRPHDPGRKGFANAGPRARHFAPRGTEVSTGGTRGCMESVCRVCDELSAGDWNGAATWDTNLVHAMAQTTSTEARAKYNQAMRDDHHDVFRPYVLGAERQYPPRSPVGAWPRPMARTRSYRTVAVAFTPECRATIQIFRVSPLPSTTQYTAAPSPASRIQCRSSPHDWKTRICERSVRP